MGGVNLGSSSWCSQVLKLKKNGTFLFFFLLGVPLLVSNAK